MKPKTKLEKLLDNLRLQMTVSVKKEDFNDLRFYYHSKVCIVVEIFDTLLPQAIYRVGKRNFLELGYETVQEIGAALTSLGAKEKKKPRSLKPTYPIYD
jgi:hypothetical protein